ncbi:putative shewanella-like protein phosphatase 2 [Cocos nucifera]|nr:putative shewanella-like protein phosphatase 2 [Cocos nucifera]
MGPGKRKSATGEGLSRASKKKKLDVALMAAQLMDVTLVPVEKINVASTIPLTGPGEAVVALVTPTVVTHDVSALERVMHDFTNICQGWCDKAKIQRKRHDASQLQKECDSCALELEEERKKLQPSEVEVASARAALSPAKELRLDKFQSSKDFKNELLANSRLTYVTEYEDDRDAVGKVYPNLDLSCVIILDFEGEEGSNDDHELGEAVVIEEASIEEAPTESVLTKEVPATSEPAPASEEPALDPPPTSNELASTMAIINAVAIDDSDR